MRVQETRVHSGRHYLSARSFDTIPAALREMKVRISLCVSSFNTYDAVTDRIKNSCMIESDDNTHFTVVHGNARRVFTLVNRRGDPPIPFGHLLKPRS